MSNEEILKKILGDLNEVTKNYTFSFNNENDDEKYKKMCDETLASITNAWNMTHDVNKAVKAEFVINNEKSNKHVLSGSIVITGPGAEDFVNYHGIDRDVTIDRKDLAK